MDNSCSTLGLASNRQIEHCPIQDVGAGGAIFLRAPFVGVVADAVSGSHEDHAHRAEVSKLHAVVPRAAREQEGPYAEPLAGSLCSLTDQL